MLLCRRGNETEKKSCSTPETEGNGDNILNDSCRQPVHLINHTGTSTSVATATTSHRGLPSDQAASLAFGLMEADAEEDGGGLNKQGPDDVVHPHGGQPTPSGLSK